MDTAGKTIRAGVFELPLLYPGQVIAPQDRGRSDGKNGGDSSGGFLEFSLGGHQGKGDLRRMPLSAA